MNAVLALVLAAAPLQAASRESTAPPVLTPTVVSGWAGAIKSYFAAPDPAPTGLRAVFPELSRVPASSAALGPVIRELAAAAAPLQHGTMSEPAAPASVEKLARLATAFPELLAPGQLRAVGSMLRFQQERLQEDRRRGLDARMNEIAAALKQEGRVGPLHDLADSDLLSAKVQIVTAASAMYREAQAEGRGGLFPIPPSFFDDLHAADARTRFSQVARGPGGKVLGFALSHFDRDYGTAHLEKLGVLPAHRKEGLTRRMLWELARRAAAFGLPAVDLLVVKTNHPAIEVYERLGFVNATPAQAWDDPRFNAFRFVVPTETLLKTDPR